MAGGRVIFLWVWLAGMAVCVVPLTRFFVKEVTSDGTLGTDSGIVPACLFLGLLYSLMWPPIVAGWVFYKSAQLLPRPQSLKNPLIPSSTRRELRRREIAALEREVLP